MNTEKLETEERPEGERLMCPLRNSNDALPTSRCECLMERCAWFVKEKEGGTKWFHGNQCAIAKLARDGVGEG